ncbi:protein MAINTENANCE OF MERISTEMS-like [Rhododendron vialii]|uniref:protein MAINTENANCE OF MERISTEMS-like n=1 Tax=Rhododendron vialii TaxID=182163 RepID=UPI00265E2D9F|nr:protein MAINTENANCE OF MERISTEMS-like [Rhododendron vialii]
MEEVEFRPAAGSSAHIPITRGDFAEFVSEEELGRLLRENPGVVAAVLAAREDRARQVERAQEEERLREEAERARAEEEAFESETEAAEEAQGEVWSFERAVTLAESIRLAPRGQFDAASYAPPEPHVFIPSGVESLAPLRESYDAELILRDPQRHLSVDWAQRGAASTRGHGGLASSLELYKSLPERVRALVDVAGFRSFILTLTPIKSDHALLTALAERWWDSSNTFHLPIGEMTVTPSDFAALTGLRVGGEPIPFDSEMYRDPEALAWFLGQAPAGEAETVHYDQFKRYLHGREPESDLEAEKMARAYLLYLFRATLYPNKRSTVHLSYLPALYDLSTASRFDWGGAALGTCYGFMGAFSRGKKATAGYWRVWELWAYEVLKMYPPENKCPNLRMLPRAMIWGPMYSGKKKSRGSLLAFRTYLDELSGTQVDWNPWSGAEPEPEYLAQSRVVTASRVLLESAFGWRWYLGDRVTRQSLGTLDFQVPGPLPPHASHTDKYTLAELRRFTVPTGLAAFLRPERDYAVYRR